MDVGGTESKRRTKVQANKSPGERSSNFRPPSRRVLFISGSWTRGVVSVVRKGGSVSSRPRERK